MCGLQNLVKMVARNDKVAHKVTQKHMYTVLFIVDVLYGRHWTLLNPCVQNSLVTWLAYSFTSELFISVCKLLCDVKKHPTEGVKITVTINVIAIIHTLHPYPVPISALYNVRVGQCDVNAVIVVTGKIDPAALYPLPVEGGSCSGMWWPTLYVISTNRISEEVEPSHRTSVLSSAGVVVLAWIDDIFAINDPVILTEHLSNSIIMLSKSSGNKNSLCHWLFFCKIKHLFN